MTDPGKAELGSHLEKKDEEELKESSFWEKTDENEESSEEILQRNILSVKLLS